MKKLAGKNAFITGGSRGIGAAMVRKFAEEGANITLTYSKSQKEAESLASELSKRFSVKINIVKADADKPATVEAAIEKAAADMGSLDILVNNAGVYAGNLIQDCTDIEFDFVMNVNVRSVFVAMRAAGNLMKAGGRIINIGSVLGERVTSQGIGLYSMSKFAVAGLTRAAARDLGPKGINVNCIQPGPTDTDMNPATSEYAAQQREKTALGRYSTPEEVAELALFLASGATSNMTGACINCDAGYNA